MYVNIFFYNFFFPSTMCAVLMESCVASELSKWSVRYVCCVCFVCAAGLQLLVYEALVYSASRY